MLEIKEPELKRRHEQVLENLIANKLFPECEYVEGEDGSNSVVHYYIEVNNQPRGGFICVNEGKFGGVILKTEKVTYLKKEGFEDEQINEEPVWAVAPCPMSFICMLAIPLINNLQFSDELMNEYQQTVAAETKKNVRKKKRRI